jgi:hypothetical protein
MMAVWLFKVLRWLVTLIYLVAVGFAFAWVIDGRGMPFPFAAVAYTVIYGILMTLLWLYERYPTQSRAGQ